MMMILDKLAFLHSRSKNIWSNNLIRMASFILSLSFIGVTLPLSGLKLWACAGMCKGKGSLSHDVQKIQSRMQWGTQLQHILLPIMPNLFIILLKHIFFSHLVHTDCSFPSLYSSQILLTSIPIWMHSLSASH